MSVSLYDLLDVDSDASSEEIRTAWKGAIADLEPGDRRFRALNGAAEVLLDPERRAKYDAELAADEEAPEPEPVAAGADAPPPAPATAPAASTAAAPAGGSTRTGLGPRVAELKRRLARPRPAEAGSPTARTGRQVPAWLLVGLLVLTLVCAGTAVWKIRSEPSDKSVDSALSTAESVARTAVPTVFSYDYRHLDEDHDKAAAYLTDSYRTENGGYDDTFNSVIKTNAPKLQAVVQAQFLSSGVIRTGGGDEADDMVEVLVVFDQVTTNKQSTEPRRSPAYAVVTMKKVDGDWLIDDVTGPEVPQ